MKIAGHNYLHNNAEKILAKIAKGEKVYTWIVRIEGRYNYFSGTFKQCLAEVKKVKKERVKFGMDPRGGIDGLALVEFDAERNITHVHEFVDWMDLDLT